MHAQKNSRIIYNLALNVSLSNIGECYNSNLLFPSPSKIMKKIQCTVHTIKVTRIKIHTFGCLLNQNTIFLLIKAHMVGKGLIKRASQTLMIRSKPVYSVRGTYQKT